MTAEESNTASNATMREAKILHAGSKYVALASLACMFAHKVWSSEIEGCIVNPIQRNTDLEQRCRACR